MAIKFIDFVLLMVILFYSSDIGDEQSLPEENSPVTEKVSAQKTNTVVPSKGRKTPRGVFPTDPLSAVSRQAFLLAFKRQAEVELLSCLKTWLPSPESITIAATLYQEGYLRSPVSLESRHLLPDCAVSAIEKMDFKNIGAQLKHPTVTLQWRIDW